MPFKRFTCFLYLYLKDFIKMEILILRKNLYNLAYLPANKRQVRLESIE